MKCLNEMMELGIFVNMVLPARDGRSVLAEPGNARREKTCRDSVPIGLPDAFARCELKRGGECVPFCLENIWGRIPSLAFLWGGSVSWFPREGTQPYNHPTAVLQPSYSRPTTVLGCSCWTIRKPPPCAAAVC